MNNPIGAIFYYSTGEHIVYTDLDKLKSDATRDIWSGHSLSVDLYAGTDNSWINDLIPMQVTAKFNVGEIK